VAESIGSAGPFHVKACQMQEPRVDIYRLLRILLLAGIVPLVFLVALDLASGLWPILTLFGAVIFLPLGSYLVGRAALDEMNRVIEEVAPLVEESSDKRSDGEVSGADESDLVVSDCVDSDNVSLVQTSDRLPGKSEPLAG
jgi:hypothetical protein